MVFTQRRRQRDVSALQHSLAVGDEVCTTSGLYGRIDCARRPPRRRWRSAPGSTSASTDGRSASRSRRHRPPLRSRRLLPSRASRTGHVALNPHKRRPLQGPRRRWPVITVVLFGLLFGANTWGSGAVDAQARPRPRGRHPDGPRAGARGHQQGLERAAQPGARHHRAARRRQRRRRGRGHDPGRPQHRREHARAADQGHRGRDPQVLAAALPPRARRRRRDAPAHADNHPSGTATGNAHRLGDAEQGAGPTATGATTTAAKSGLPQALREAARPRRRRLRPRPRRPRSPLPRPPRARPVQLPPASRRTPATSTWITEDIAAQFKALDCTTRVPLDKIVDDPTKPLVTCSDDGAREVHPRPGRGRAATRSRTPSSGYRATPTASRPSSVEIRLSFNGSGTKALRRRHEAPGQPARAAQPVRGHPRLQGAHRADRASAAILNGQASITGDFTIDERPRPGQPAQVRRPAAVVHAADPRRHQPDPRQRAAPAAACSPA